MKLGVIGCGGIADRRTIPGILQVPEIELVAVSDVSQDIANRVAGKYGVGKAVDSLQGVLDADVDAVYIATPVYLHREQCLAAAAAGKHVLVEKPLAADARDALEVIDACRSAGVVLQEGYMMKFHPLHAAAKSMIEARKLGKPVLLRGQLSCWYPPMEGAWRQRKSLGGGGSLIDMASHIFDLFEWMCGPISAVCASIDNLVHDYETEDTAVSLLRFANGARGMVDSLFNVPDASVLNRLEIYGSRGSLIADGTIGQEPGGSMFARMEDDAGGYDAVQQREALGAVQVSAPKLDSLYAQEFRHLLAVIEGREQPLNGSENALRMAKLIDAAYESAGSGRWVDVE